jgi:glucose-1-phosphate cytidylyltransferase
MKLYSAQGFRDFLVAVGYRGEAIKRYFIDYASLDGSMTVDVARGQIEQHKREADEWIVHLVDTGQETQTGGRIKRLEPWVGSETFMVTYGDGVADIDLRDLLRFHRKHGRIATVTAVRPPSRFGGLVFDGDLVAEFTEKPQIGEGWINGGFLVFEAEIFKYLHDDRTVLEADALEQLAEERQLVAYKHERFWQCMDTLRDKRLLEGLWESGQAPWKLW